MLYLGHFSFSQDMPREDTRGTEPWHGYFTTVAEAPDANAAVKKFQRLIKRLGSSEMFEGVRDIYLDVCIEIHAIPARGFLAHFSSHTGEDLGGISTSVRGAQLKEATIFDLEADDSEEEQEREPFIVLRHQPRLVDSTQGRVTARDVRS